MKPFRTGEWNDVGVAEALRMLRLPRIFKKLYAWYWRYIRRDEIDDFEPWQIFERTTAVDCAGDRALNFPGESQREFLFEGWTIQVPAQVYVLANHPTGRDGHHIFIDTERGTVILADVQVGPKPTKLSQVDSPPVKSTPELY